MIGTVKKVGNDIAIYDENGSFKTYVPVHDGLVGFTSTTVSIKVGNDIAIYDENGSFQTYV
ncbi:MAG: hypothetical protein IKJ76_00055 [Fibrobacter sp.]|nr:hypothetical protein [Fibrobacter sp.]